MRIITISREFGSGGRALAKRLADHLNYDYYDSEILTAVANNSKTDENYVKNMLSDHGWQQVPINYRCTFTTNTYSNKINLLLQQKQVIEEIASLGKDFIIVGRNADIILKDYHPFNIFVCATTESKLKRCIERAPKDENLTEKELLHKMKQIDKNRSKTREILTNSKWGQKDSYHLTVNTTNWEIKELVDVVSTFANKWFEK